MLKPGGTLSFAVGNLSSAAGIGGGATGASLAAASFPAGRPIRGEPGGSAGAAAGAAAVGGLAGAGCCAAAPYVNAPIKAPASNRLRGDEQIIMTSSPVWRPILARASTTPAPVAFLTGSLQYFPVDAQSETSVTTVNPGRAARTRNLEIVLLSTFYVEIPGPVLRTIRNDGRWMTAGRQCLVTGSSEKSRIASANGNSSTISPSSSVTSRIAFRRPPSAPSVFSSSRIMARAISHAGSEINSSPMRVLKKYRGIGRNPLRLGRWFRGNQRHLTRICPFLRNTPAEVEPRSAS